MKSQFVLTPALGASLLLAAAQVFSASADPRMGESMVAFEMEYLQRDPADVQRRIARLGQVFAGRELRLGQAMEAITRSDEAGWHAPFADAPALLVRYLAKVDELRLLDDALAQDLEPKESIDQPSALKLAGRYLEFLGRAGMIDLRHYDLKRAEVGFHKVSGGSMKSNVAEFERITEYRVTLRPALNGIELANGGVRLGIHASGKLVGLRVGGVTVKSIADGAADAPAAGGQHRVRMVQDEHIERQFAQSVTRGAEPKVHWSRLMYVMPEGATKAVVEPTRVYAFSEAHRVDGLPVTSRRRIIGYSVTDIGAASIDHTPASKRSESAPEPVRTR